MVGADRGAVAPGEGPHEAPLPGRLDELVPSMTARMAATFDRLSGGRLLVNVVTGGDPSELAGDGGRAPGTAGWAAKGGCTCRVSGHQLGVRAQKLKVDGGA